jgi:uncharacterized membrane protein
MKKPDSTFIHTLETEAGTWLEEGIIEPEQKDRILGRYAGIQAAEDKAGPTRLITTISVLGSILVGIGVLLFVASNWSRIPNAGRLAIIFISLLACYGTGFFLRYEHRNFPRAGAGLILLGSFIFGAGIFLIAQMYHISVHYPNGPLLWGLAVLPLAYLLGLNSLLSLALVDLLIWLGMEATFSLSFFSAYGNITVFIALFLLAGITLWASGLMHRGFPSLKHLSGPYLGTGLFLTLACGYVLTFEFMQWHFGAPALTSFYYGFTVLFVASLALFIVKGEKGKTWIAETVFLAALFLIVLLFCFTSKGFLDTSPEAYSAEYTRRNQDYSLLRLAFNLLYALQILGVIVLGYLRRNRAYINLGLVFFVLEVIARYFDFFWKLMPRSLFFIGGGLLLMVGGIVLEKKRRTVLASFNLEAD